MYISAATNIKDITYKSDLLIPPTINHAFSKNEVLGNTMVHIILGHVMTDKVDKMAKLDIILDSLKRKTQRYREQILDVLYARRQAQ